MKNLQSLRESILSENRTLKSINESSSEFKLCFSLDVDNLENATNILKKAKLDKFIVKSYSKERGPFSDETLDFEVDSASEMAKIIKILYDGSGITEVLSDYLVTVKGKIKT